MRLLEPAATMMATQWEWQAAEDMTGGDCLQSTDRVGKRIHRGGGLPGTPSAGPAGLQVTTARFMSAPSGGSAFPEGGGQIGGALVAVGESQRLRKVRLRAFEIAQAMACERDEQMVLRVAAGLQVFFKDQ